MGTLDTFTSPTVKGLIDHTGELGPWTLESGVGHGAALDPTNGRLRSNGGSATIYSMRGLQAGSDHWCEATYYRGTATSVGGIALAVRVNGGNSAYWGRYNAATDVWEVYKIVSGTSTMLGSTANTGFGFDSPGSSCRVRLTANGSTISLAIGGTTVITATDTSLTGGNPGLRSATNYASGAGPEIDDYTGGSVSLLALNNTSNRAASSITTSDESPSAITLTTGTGQPRYTLTYNQTLPLGTLVRMRVFGNAGARFIIRTGTAASINSGSVTYYDGNPPDDGIDISFTIGTSSTGNSVSEQPYFGFLVLNSSQTFRVTGFSATTPPPAQEGR